MKEYVFRGIEDFEKFVDDEINEEIYTYLSNTYNFDEIQLIFRISFETVAYYLNIAHPEIKEDNKARSRILQRLELWSVVPGNNNIDTKHTLEDVLLVSFLLYCTLPYEVYDSYHFVYCSQLRREYEDKLDKDLDTIVNSEIEKYTFDTYFELVESEDEEPEQKQLCKEVQEIANREIISGLTLSSIPEERVKFFERIYIADIKRLQKENEDLRNEIAEMRDMLNGQKEQLARNVSIRPAEVLLNKSFCPALFNSSHATDLLRQIVHEKIKDETCGRAPRNNENWTWAHVRRAMVRCGFFGECPKLMPQDKWEDMALSDTDFGYAINSCDQTISPQSVKTQCTNHKDKHGTCDENIVSRICEYLQPIIKVLHNKS